VDYYKKYKDMFFLLTLIIKSFQSYFMGSRCHNSGRRSFIKKAATLTTLYLVPSVLVKAVSIDNVLPVLAPKERIKITINGKLYDEAVDIRMTLLDFIREQIGLTGTKKGCAMGQCGACIVHVDGKRQNSCLALAVFSSGKSITTIEGLANGDQLHPLQEAFVIHDALQCGYCTPGQIMSGIACIREGQAGSRESIRRFMSGNICRCGAYQNIVDAIEEVNNSGKTV
jgi:xanthine dehydrogenase YagT iron-sulfur-binding subunit